MKGYYKMPEATAAAIDADGWLHTGDLARRDADGNYKITGRIKDMIIRGGENIYPKEIEDFIYTHPKVQDVQVIGVPDEQYGEEIMAVRHSASEGETLTEDEMKDYIRSHMAKHKVPRYICVCRRVPDERRRQDPQVQNARGRRREARFAEGQQDRDGVRLRAFRPKSGYASRSGFGTAAAPYGMQKADGSGAVCFCSA